MPDDIAEPVIALKDQYFDLKGLSAYSALAVSTLRDYIRKGRLPCFKLEGKILVRRSDFDQWIDQFRKKGIMAKRPDKKEISQMVALHRLGHTPKSIARRLGRSHHTVQRYLRSEIFQNDTEIKAMIALIKDKELEDLTLLGAKARGRLHQLLDQGETKAIETTAIMDRSFQQRRLLEGESTENLALNREYIFKVVSRIDAELDKLEAEPKPGRPKPRPIQPSRAEGKA